MFAIIRPRVNFHGLLNEKNSKFASKNLHKLSYLLSGQAIDSLLKWIHGIKSKNKKLQLQRELIQICIERIKFCRYAIAKLVPL